MYSNNCDIGTILSSYTNKYGFRRFEEFGIVRIGVVTGANDYFILDEEGTKQYGFSETDLVPILISSKEFAGFSLNGKKPLKKLVVLSPRDGEKFKSYIMKGVKSRYHLRSHPLLRDHWYCVVPGDIPNAFFPYRTVNIPYMIVNNRQVQCTNSIHRIYFKKRLSACEQKWLQVSLLSVPGQLSIEAHSKTYGSGVLKIEPNSLKKAIAYKSEDKSINPIYNEISKSLSLNQKVDAMMHATEFINEKLHIPAELSALAHSALTELQQRRLDR